MTRRLKLWVAGCVAGVRGCSAAADRQIGVDPALATAYSQLTGGAPAPWTVAGGSLAAGYWQRSSGAAPGVGSNNVVNAEFQLPETPPTRVRSASYQFSGRYSQCAGDEPVVFDVYAYAADGRANPADATAGTRVGTVSANCRDNPAFARPIDVTAIVRQLSVPSGMRFVGFSVRKGNNRRGPGYFFINPGKLTIVLASEDLRGRAVRPVAGAGTAGTPAAGGETQFDPNKLFAGLAGAAATVLRGGGQKPARDQGANEAVGALANSTTTVPTDPTVPIAGAPAASPPASPRQRRRCRRRARRRLLHRRSGRTRPGGRRRHRRPQARHVGGGGQARPAGALGGDERQRDARHRQQRRGDRLSLVGHRARQPARQRWLGRRDRRALPAAAERPPRDLRRALHRIPGEPVSAVRNAQAGARQEVRPAELRE